MQKFDVVVVGKGNAALCAALSAHDKGASVAMLEAASIDESGGNSRADVPMCKVNVIYARADDLVSIASCRTRNDSAKPRWAAPKRVGRLACIGFTWPRLAVISPGECRR